MILLFIEFLKNHFGVHSPAVFSYSSTRTILAAATALTLTLSFGNFFIQKLYELKIGQPIREFKGFLLAELHRNKKNTPTMGGALILFSVLVAGLLWLDLSSPYSWILIFTMIVLGVLGGWDDYLKLRYKSHAGLSPKKKLLVQFIWALIVIAYLQIPQVNETVQYLFGLKVPVIKEFAKSGSHAISLFDYSSRLYFPFFKEPIVIFSGISLIVLWLFLSIVVVGASNAVNLTDGLDGLASGLVVGSAFVLCIFAFLSNHIDVAEYLNLLYVDGAKECAIFLAATGGACLGFLWFNSHPAEVFMGDIGSLSIGAVLGVSSILLKREFLFGLVGAIFVMEALSVVLQVACFKLFDKRRVFLCAPLHHHFEYLGWPESKVVIRFWIIGFLLSLIGIASIKFQ